MNINIFKTEEEVLDGLATYFVATASQSIAANGRFSVVLSGGSSPKKLYEILASTYKNEVEWAKVDFFFGDERYVPQTDAQSNFLMAKKAIFEPLNIAATQIFAVDTTPAPDVAAAQYALDITTYFGDKPLSFDLVLLGLGDNSHTASLFPYTPVLHDDSVSVKAVFLKDQDVYRITFTAPLINHAHNIAYLVYGQGKAIAVHHVIEDKRDIENYPAQLIAPTAGSLQWFVDEAAASKLTTAALK